MTSKYNPLEATVQKGVLLELLKHDTKEQKDSLIFKPQLKAVENAGRPDTDIDISRTIYSSAAKVLQISKAGQSDLNRLEMDVKVGDVVQLQDHALNSSNYYYKTIKQGKEFDGYLLINPSLIQSIY